MGGINNDFIKSVKQGESELRENIGSLSSALQSKQTDIQRSLQESIDN
ncbi:MAG: hypothetical protein U9Q15_04140 [Patescibacteria group bacterium]|nr:hypothetical protein [Patescibacteria group bacterium]